MNILEQSNMLLQEATTAVARIEDVISRIQYLAGHNQAVTTDVLADLINAKALVFKAASVVAVTPHTRNERKEP